MAESLMLPRTNLATGAWVNVLLGLLVMAVPFTTFTTEAAMTSNLLAGLLVAGLALVQARSAVRGMAARAQAPAWANVLLGLWVILAGFLLAAGPPYLWANAILGFLIVVAAAYGVSAAGRRRTMLPPTGPA